MSKDEKPNTLKARLADLKTKPPRPDAFELSLRNALARESAMPAQTQAAWQTWVKGHPLLSGAATGLMTALFVLYVATPNMQPRTGMTPSQETKLAQEAMPNPNEQSQVTNKINGATHRVPTQGVALIKFHFSSEVAVADVNMQIELPAGLKFWSKGQELEQNAVAWQSRLKAGENTFPVAISARKEGLYQVMATAEIDGQVVQHEVVIEVFEGA